MNEVEEFLRRVAQRRQQMAQQAQPAATPAMEPQRGMPARPPFPPAQVVEAEILDDDDEGVSTADVVRHVSQHLDSRQFDERARHLGEATRLSEQRLERQVEQRFQGDVSKLASRKTADSASAIRPQSSTDAGSPDAAGDSNAVTQLVAMLRDRTSLRNAILLSEILNRPEDRW